MIYVDFDYYFLNIYISLSNNKSLDFQSFDDRDNTTDMGYSYSVFRIHLYSITLFQYSCVFRNYDKS